MRRIIRLFKAAVRFVLDSQYRHRLIAASGIYSGLSDEKYLQKKYYANTGRRLDLLNPKTFNEKLQWLKIYDRNPMYTVMSDKNLVKDYVAGIIGEDHIVPTIGVWDKPEEIDFNILPNQFVLKCNHNSGLGMCICKDKSRLDIKKVLHDLERGLAQDYYARDREWQYKDISRKIIAERFMEDKNASQLTKETNADGLFDYKFYCFNGVPRFLYVGFANVVDGQKHDHMSFLTLDWKRAPFYRTDHEQIPLIPDKPICFQEMIECASTLSSGIPFVRVDFFVIDEQFYFSEFTFAPGAGYGIFYPEEWERRFGDWICLPNKVEQ